MSSMSGVGKEPMSSSRYNASKDRTDSRRKELYVASVAYMSGIDAGRTDVVNFQWNFDACEKVASCL